MELVLRNDKGIPLSYVEGDNNIIFLNRKLTVINSAPTNIKDESLSYKTNDLWLDLYSDSFYYCEDNTLNNAVWKRINLGGTGLTQQDGGNGLGWRLLNRTSINFGAIGYGAIDFSESDTPNSNFGATDYRSFTAGFNITTTGEYSTWFGKYNNAIATIEFGIGNGISGTNSNLFEIHSSGVLKSPTLALTDITHDKHFINKEYFNANKLNIGEGLTTAFRGDLGKESHDHAKSQHFTSSDGTTLGRPATPMNGSFHYDTDLAIPIWYRSSNDTWIDALGVVV